MESSEVRARIFASALRAFANKGYAATSLREIAEHANTTKPMIYYYFGSKDELYSNIVHVILEEMGQTIQRGLPTSGSAQEQVLAYCDHYLQHFVTRRETFALVLREVFGLGGTPMDTFAQTLRQEVREPLDALLHQGMSRGEFRAEDAPGCAIAITGIMNMFILAHVFAGAEISIEGALAQVRYYVAGLTAGMP